MKSKLQTLVSQINQNSITPHTTTHKIMHRMIKLEYDCKKIRYKVKAVWMSSPENITNGRYQTIMVTLYT